MFGVFQTVAGATREGGTPLGVCPLSGLQGASGHSEPPLLRPSGTPPPQEEDAAPRPFHVFFDIESRQEDGQHLPNLVVAETKVEDDPFRFQGETCLQQFTTWLDYLSEETRRFLTVLAHNFQGYNSYPLVEEYHHQKRVLEQTRNGAKILQLKVGGIRFIDSLSFFQMALSAFPKTFGLTELKKGYFPHLFNTRTNQGYVGPLPPKDAYLPDSLSVQGRQDFERWYADQVARGVQFDFQQELQAVGRQTAQARVSDFQARFRSLGTFQPLRSNDHCFGLQSRSAHQSHGGQHHRLRTLARLACQHQPLPRGHAVVEVGGSPVRPTAPACTEQERVPHPGHPLHRRRLRCHHEHRLRVSRVLLARLSPLSRQETHARLLDRTMEDAYRTTQAKVQSLRDRGYTVVEMWECDWHQRLQDQPQVADYVARRPCTFNPLCSLARHSLADAPMWCNCIAPPPKGKRSVITITPVSTLG